MKVLIITRSDDNACIEMVSEAVAGRGGSVIRFNTDEFPTDARITAEYGAGAERLRLIDRQGEHDLGEVTAIWYRRTRFGAGIPETMERQLRHGSVQESRSTALGMIASLRAFQMEPLTTIRAAGHKQLQLQLARELGLEIPATLITNDPDEVRSFANRHPGGIVAKMLSSFHVMEENVEKVVFTNPVPPEALEDLSGLHLSPMTFQEQVPKKRELRVTLVGTRAFAAALETPAHEGAGDDWRRKGVDLVNEWAPCSLPAEVERSLIRLMERLDLNYGAVDVILTPDGRYVFLELNPVGEYFWLEGAAGLPISGAIADVLLGKVPQRAHGRSSA